MTLARSANRRVKGLTRRLRARRSIGPDETVARLDRQSGRIGALERDLARIGPQVAALEARVEDLRQRLETPELRDGEYAEAVSLVEEVRREHHRIRARITAATRFEERLRRLEDRFADVEARGSGYQAVQPPSTTSVEPVTKDDAGEAR
ncbi:MAG: hypothetical protein ACRDPR_18405 [Nocardioidaceae bacterium]